MFSFGETRSPKDREGLFFVLEKGKKEKKSERNKLAGAQTKQKAWRRLNKRVIV